MLNITKSALIITLVILISGCAVHGNRHEEKTSKEVRPPEGLALIYIIRASGHKAGIRSIPFIFNNEVVGELWRNQYLYFFSEPMDMRLPTVDGGVGVIKIEPNSQYYLLYGFEMGVLDSFIHPKDFWSEPPHYQLMNEADARKLIDSYNLSGKFRKVTLGSSGAVNLEGSSTKILIDPTNRTYESIYENDTKSGAVTVSGGTNLRNYAIEVIKDICIIKNIALSTSDIAIDSDARFLTLSESLANDKLSMKFECLY